MVFLDQLRPAALTQFRSHWGNGSATTRRKHERLVAFFWFCVRMEWLDKNPALLLKRVKVDSTPTDYFTKKEFAALVDATHAYGNWLGGHDYDHRRDRVRALILLMRWSGLAITDAVTLERSRLDQTGNVFLYRAKTGVPVYVPLPPSVHSLLKSLPSDNPRYFFWSGNGDPETCKRGWTRSLARLFKLADIQKPDGAKKRCHSHMFRDTFAVELLLAGTTIDQVALLLGHSSVKVTEKHYAPFVKARQEQLAESARNAWDTQEKTAASRTKNKTEESHGLRRSCHPHAWVFHHPALRSFRCTRNITVSGMRSVVYPRLNRFSWLAQSKTPGSFSNILRMVFSLKFQRLASSATE